MGENLKNCKHLVFIDLQKVVQIFVSLEVYAKKKKIIEFRVHFFYPVQTSSGTILNLSENNLNNPAKGKCIHLARASAGH